ncbi:HAD-IIIA family hydrolase [Reichenbachiella agarivorans]|uniref:HAD-IIIA family hydrolase n=1 Tax=Reichenbachiella agarivorans TaxID=2979464 RepID=A0ABY6CQ31_9BACT|nr:HAD-IIIA family hydrolase [Reichenbachiella agarivorans]UXP32479.1 HAD-IIIA family hydrolase [Reichenbachiella agarivorans]
MQSSRFKQLIVLYFLRSCYIIAVMIDTYNIKMVVLDVDGTMTDGSINVMDDGTQFKKFSAKDGLGIKMLLNQGIIVAIISHSSTASAIEARAKMLGIKYVYAGHEEKDVILAGWLLELGLDWDQVAFIGDDLNDLPAMRKVGLSACPADSSQEVLEYVDVILTTKGGDGCVREFIDQHMMVTYQKFTV